MSSEIKFKQKYNKETFREEVDAIIPKEILDKNFEKAAAEIQKTAALQGFRKGHVPKDIVMARFMREISDKAVNFCINDAVRSMKDLEPTPLEPLDVINFTKNDESGELTVIFSYLPKPSVKVGDLTKIKVSEKEPNKASKAEVEKEMENVGYEYAKSKNQELKREDFKLAQIDDKFIEEYEISKHYKDVKTVADLYKFVENFINNTYIANSSNMWEKDVRQAVIKASEFEKVEGLVNKEVEKRVENYKARFTQLGINPETYLAEQNIDLNKLKEEWQPQADEDVKLELVLQEFGADHKIEPTEEDYTKNMNDLDDATRRRYDNNPEVLRSLIRYYYINQNAYEKMIEMVKSNSTTSKAKGEKTEKKESKKASK